MSHTAPRLPYPKLAPKAYRALAELGNALHAGPLGRTLVDLVYLRVSQINGCAYCIDLHWRDLIAQDQDPRRLNGVAGWREMPFFTERERAALNWAELVTGIPHREPDDASFAELKVHFTDAEIADLGFAIAAMNAWNRLGISFRNEVPAQV